ncbi:hypothetical protein BDE02_11G075800 [Populus trichocarpa]|nr:hypothetical protein BDE02_11G075800 [Populus trichocarpa]
MGTSIISFALIVCLLQKHAICSSTLFKLSTIQTSLQYPFQLSTCGPFKNPTTAKPALKSCFMSLELSAALLLFLLLCAAAPTAPAAPRSKGKSQSDGQLLCSNLVSSSPFQLPDALLSCEKMLKIS